ncbi:hypothetical protein WNZ14_03490 [Hoeflea sp. AS60]|uniref:hypothetical protein n=1 Tax=Hoeflea sp. AS60 TaxID=3135780 RepID=UPI00316F4F21
MYHEKMITIAAWPHTRRPLSEAIDQLVSDGRYSRVAAICIAMSEIVQYHCELIAEVTPDSFDDIYEMEVSIVPNSIVPDIVLIRRKPLSENEECPAYFL